MAKKRTYRVVDGRMNFVCPECHTRRLVGVSPHLKNRSIKCHKCSTVVSCTLNRRETIREQQFGKVLLTRYDRSVVEVNLLDISTWGVGFELPFRELKKLSVGERIEFRCPWNPKLLGSSAYVIRAINGRRVGAERLRKS
ncbi:hypothetical protein [Desulforhopalus singaporensis]|uniref:PilZ domain-containing protein n=1 Tax=Desulforhopalus singaporensis TaxID=91360 RepID=A0A1H0IYH6_9BACT|nr:hypothetical protein [Desulforhopalus singaporensis]SDO36161.1 hypothetical protein SAMN05660330_00065 [Desulforhopalus singaporensis]